MNEFICVHIYMVYTDKCLRVESKIPGVYMSECICDKSNIPGLYMNKWICLVDIRTYACYISHSKAGVHEAICLWGGYEW